MDINLRDKVALVTGGSRGIGRAISIRLARAGANVAINFLRHKTAAEQTAQEIEATGSKALIIRANVAERNEIEHMMSKIQKHFGKLDILVSNAASGVIKPALELTEKHWRWTMDINAGTLLPLVQLAMPLFGENGGQIIAVSSLGAMRAIPNYTAVGASKAALESIVRHLALELGPRKINVNAISAGVVETDALKHFPNREQLIKASKETTPTGRLTTPEDVANMALFLCCEHASQIQGQTIIVDGGHSILA